MCPPLGWGQLLQGAPLHFGGTLTNEGFIEITPNIIQGAINTITASYGISPDGGLTFGDFWKDPAVTHM